MNSGSDSSATTIPTRLHECCGNLLIEEYRQAAQTYLNVKTAAAVRTQEEDTSADFAEAKPEVHLDYAMPAFQLDRKEWEDRVRHYSSYFRKYPEIYSSAVMVIGQKSQVRFVSHREAPN